MQSAIKRVFFLAFVAISGGCALPTLAPPPPPIGSLPAAGLGAESSELIVRALSTLNAPYRYGGHSPETGFDCSGLMFYVYGQAMGLTLPRRTQDMRHAGEETTLAALQPGDLVFFNTLRQPFSHVGMYLGEGNFIHAPTHNGRVRIERMQDPYWASRFNGARRIRGGIGPVPQK